MSFNAYDIKLKAKVQLPTGDTVSFEIESFQSNWDINGIPTCMVTATLGRLASNGVTPSIIHTIVNAIPRTSKLFVYGNVTPLSGTDAPDLWPNGWFTLFEGYATATGYDKQYGNACFTIGGLHWLADLDFSSPFSDISHPTNPWQWSVGADWAQLGAGPAGSADNNALAGMSIAYQYMNPTVVATDFWGTPGKGLLAYLMQLSLVRRFNWEQIEAVGGKSPPDRGINITMAAALSRFEPVYKGGYDFGIPLVMSLTDASEFIAAKGISDYVGSETVESFSGITIWEKLIGQFSPSFMFSVIPMIDRALVVPFTPWSREITATIKPKDYGFIQATKPLMRPFRGVAIVSGRALECGSNLPRAQPPAPSYIFADGYYENASTGMIMVTSGPRWMMNLNLNTVSQQTSGISAPKSTSVDPEAGQDGGNPLVRNIDGLRRLCNKYAKARYLQEVLNGRSLVLSGKLRIDIGVGSNIEIEGEAEKFLTGGNFEEQRLYGTVLRLTMNVDVRNKTASTAFHVGYVRNEFEEKSDTYTSDNNPLWNLVWSGGPLSSEL